MFPLPLFPTVPIIICRKKSQNALYRSNIVCDSLDADWNHPQQESFTTGLDILFVFKMRL